MLWGCTDIPAFWCFTHLQSRGACFQLMPHGHQLEAAATEKQLQQPLRATSLALLIPTTSLGKPDHLQGREWDMLTANRELCLHYKSLGSYIILLHWDFFCPVSVTFYFWCLIPFMVWLCRIDKRYRSAILMSLFWPALHKISTPKLCHTAKINTGCSQMKKGGTCVHYAFSLLSFSSTFFRAVPVDAIHWNHTVYITQKASSDFIISVPC